MSDLVRTGVMVPSGDPVTSTTTVRAAGPYDTERQARELPAVRAIYDAMRPPIDDARRAELAAMRAGLIADACEAAGIELGAHDRRIVAWLGTWEPQTCAVIAGLISRAAAGRQATGTAALADGSAVISAADLPAVAGALADAARSGGPGSAAYVRIGRSLGDDR